VTPALTAVASRPPSHGGGRRRGRHDAQHARRRAAAALPDAVEGGDGGRHRARLHALDQRDQRDGHGARVDEAIVADVDARDHQRDGHRAERDAGGHRPPAPPRGGRPVERTDQIGVEDEAEADDARRLDDVVIVHGG